MSNEKKEEKQDTEETVGQGNPRDEMRAHLYKQADERRAADGEFTDVADEDHDKTVEIVEEEKKEEVRAEPAKRKFKVNGKEIELTDEEIAERVSKSEAADQKFQEAARLRKEAEELKQASVKAAPAETVQSDDEDRALARALQMGSEEEALQVIKKLRHPPAIKTDDVTKIVDQRLNFESQKQKFLGEYKDVMDDPYWREVVLDRDEQIHFRAVQLLNSGEQVPADMMPGYERFKKAGEWARELKKKSSPPQESTQQKLERKSVHASSQVRAANVRQAPAQDEDKEESASEVIAGMAAKRGQTVVRGNV